MTDGLFANPLHWAILLVIVLIIFGPGKLPSVGNALGKSIREFKKASQDDTPTAAPQYQSTGQIPAPAPVLATSAAVASSGSAGIACSNCSKENPADGRFCVNCGSALVTTPEPEVVVAAAPAKLTCAKCGTENHATNRFCLHCGQVVEQAVASL